MSEKQVTRFIAIHQFKAEEDQDLALEKGQLVLGNFLEDDWWVGEDPANGNAGVFPNNFVAIEGSEAADKCLRKLEKKDPENVHVLAAKASESQMIAGMSDKKKGLVDVAESRPKMEPMSSTNFGNNNGDDDLDQVNINIDDDMDPTDDPDNVKQMNENGDENNDQDEDATPMSSQEAASKAASQTSAATATTTTIPVQSIWRAWLPKIALSAAKCIFAMLAWTCLAAGEFHNLSFISNVTGIPQVAVGEGADSVWYIVTAVQFSIAWCILIWMFEFVLTIVFIKRRGGTLPDQLLTLTDKMPLVFLLIDLTSLFMLSVAGFNMGAAASLPPHLIKLLLSTNFSQAALCDTSTIIAADGNTTAVTVTGGNEDNLNICKFFFCCFWSIFDYKCLFSFFNRSQNISHFHKTNIFFLSSSFLFIIFKTICERV